MKFDTIHKINTIDVQIGKYTRNNLKKKTQNQNRNKNKEKINQKNSVLMFSNV